MEILPAHHYQFSGLLTAVASLFLVILVYRKGVDRYLKIRFALYYLSLFIWSLSLFICTSVYDYQIAYFFTQMTHAGAILIPVFFLHFTFAYLNRITRIERIILWILYAVAAFFMVINLFFRDLFFGDVVPKLSFPYFPNAGPFYTPWVITFALAVVTAHLVLLKAMLAASGIRKKQIRFFLIANALGYFGGIGCFVPVYDLPYFPFPYGPYGVFLLSLVSGYAILRYRFIDLQILLKKSIVFAALFALIIGTFSFMLFFFQNIVSAYININPFLIASIGAVVIILVYDPFREFLTNITDKYLFQKKNNIKVILQRLSERILTLLAADQIGETILATMQETLRVEAGIIFINHESRQSYRILAHCGSTSNDLTTSIQEMLKHPDLFEYLTAEGRIISMDDQADSLPIEISGWMDLSKYRVSIPLQIDKDVRGILALGKKKSDQDYVQDEIDFFPTIASQASLAIRNALLIETVLEEREAKVKAEDAARRVHYAETLGHEMKNKLAMSVLTTKNITERIVPKFRSIHEKYLVGKIADDLSKAMQTLYDQVYKSSQELKAHLDIMKIITKTAQSHLSLDSEIFEEVYVKMVWEDTVKDLNVKGVHLQFIDPSSRNFIIWGNPVRLQQVFRNLIQNSLDAMSEQADKSITLECSMKELEGKKVGYFAYTDNGPGISSEFQSKIFEKGSSTKTRSGDFMDSGSGYGLYLCKDIIEMLHKGKMWYDKTYTGGARFVFWIPIQNVKEE